MRRSFRATTISGIDAAGTQPVGRDLSGQPVIVVVNFCAAILMEIMVPLCWEALILLSLFAAFVPS